MLTLPAPYYQDKTVTIYHARMEDILPLLDLSEVACILADPPYGIGIQKADGRVGNVTNIATAHPSAMTGDAEPFTPPAALLSMLDSAKVCLWGANHYSASLPASPGWLVWDKREIDTANHFADGELAWTNFSGVVRIFRHYWNGAFRRSERFSKYHPTQKPVALMKWCLGLAKLEPGALILDPYTGSGPVLRAAKDMGFRAIGIDSLEWCCERAAERCRQGALPLEAAAV